MWIKICGNTNLEDARLAAELGADAVGFIFSASKRQVTAAQVAAIAGKLPENVERVGVFDSQDAEAIAWIAREASLHAVQLHGGYDEEVLRQLGVLFASSGIRIIQTLHWTVGEKYASAHNLIAAVVDHRLLQRKLTRIYEFGVTDRVLIDSKIGSSPSGGTGMTFDWDAARNLFASAPASLRLIVAGGLRPENVGQAVAELAPWGVDVSSGVEASVGRKDPAKLAQFIQNARSIS